MTDEHDEAESQVTELKASQLGTDMRHFSVIEDEASSNDDIVNIDGHSP